MSLYVVERPTRVADVHCKSDTPTYNNLTTPDVVVWTRFGRACKTIPTRQAARVGGRVRDLDSRRIVFDASNGV